MDPKLQEMFDGLRTEIGKSAEAVQAVTAIQERVATGETNLKKAHDEIKIIRESYDAVQKEIESLKRETRVRAIARDGVTDRREGLALLGAQLRANLAHHLGLAIPERFAGEAEMVRDFQKRSTLNAGATTGSYLVPTIVESEIMEAVEAVSPLVGMCDFQPGLPGKMDLPTLATRPSLTYKRTTIDTDATASDPVIGRVQFAPDEGYIFFPVDNILLEMSAVQLGSYCQTLIRDGILDGLSYAILNADGTSTYNSLTGVLKETTAGYISSLPGGKTAFSDVTKGDLTAAKAKALRKAQNIGVWLVGAYILGLIEDFDRTGKREVITDGPSGLRCLGNPVVVDAYMPTSSDSAAATGFAVFGDLKTMFVGLVGGIKIAVSTEVLFKRNQTGFRGVINFDIKRKPFAGLITLKTAAE